MRKENLVTSEKIVEGDMLAAEVALSGIFAKGGNRMTAASVIGEAKSFGLTKAQVKAARKGMGIVSVCEEGVYWWYWPEEIDAVEVNRSKSKELLRRYDHEGEGHREIFDVGGEKAGRQGV